jgi:hypothetical protein
MSEPITPDRIRVTADHLEEVGDDLCEWLRKIADRMEKKPEPIKARSDLSHAVQRLAMPIQVSMPTLYRADEDMLMPELRAEYPFRDRREAAWITPPEELQAERTHGVWEEYHTRRIHRTQQHALSEIDVTKPYLVETDIEHDPNGTEHINVAVSGTIRTEVV